jgi:hypothetical protein
MANGDYSSFPIHMFRSDPLTLSTPERVRYLIETRSKLKTMYGRSYRRILNAIKTVKDGTDPGLAEFTEEQLSTLERYLIKARDETARGFSQTISLFEITTNELAPGTFLVGNRPVTSFDFGDWLEKVCDWVVNLLHDIADIFHDVGMDSVGDGIDASADWLYQLEQYAKQQMNPQPNDPPD